MNSQDRPKDIKQGDLMKKELVLTESGEIKDELLFLKHCRKLAEIVCNKHYEYVKYHDRDDLYSVAVMKAYDLVSKGEYNIESGSLKSYLYTGMRNEMKNYLYKNSRDVPVDDEILLGINQSYEDPTDGTYDLS